jgi:hypothetical protein
MGGGGSVDPWVSWHQFAQHARVMLDTGCSKALKFVTKNLRFFTCPAKMGKHAMPRKPSTLKRTVAAGAIAGCGAISLGALSGLASPMANAHTGF